jgi:hypothetical protein
MEFTFNNSYVILEIVPSTVIFKHVKAKLYKHGKPDVPV